MSCFRNRSTIFWVYNFEIVTKALWYRLKPSMYTLVLMTSQEYSPKKIEAASIAASALPANRQGKYDNSVTRL